MPNRTSLVVELLAGVGYYDSVSGGSAITANSTVAKRWEDQSGHGNHATDSTGAIVATNTQNGYSGLTFNGNVLTTASIFSSSNDTALTQIVVSKANTGNTGAMVSASNSGLNWFFLRAGSWQLNTNALSNSAAFLSVPSAKLMDTAIVAAKYDGTKRNFQVNGYGKDVNVTGNLGLSGGLTIGRYSGGGFNWPEQIIEVYVFSTALSDTDLKEWIDYIGTKFNLPSRYNPVACDGNSQTRGAGGGTPYPTQLAALLDKNYDVLNYGVDSQTIADMNSDAASQIDVLYDAAANPYRTLNSVFWEGTNRLYFGASAATTISELHTYGAARKAAGFRTVILTILPRQDSGVPGTFEADRATVNADIRDPANLGVYWDDVVDVAADSRLSDPNDTTYFTGDKVHLTTLGYGIVAAGVYASVYKTNALNDTLTFSETYAITKLQRLIDTLTLDENYDIKIKDHVNDTLTFSESYSVEQSFSLRLAELPGFVCAPITKEMRAASKIWSDTARTTPVTADNSQVRAFQCTYSGLIWTIEGSSSYGTLKDEGAGDWSIDFAGDCWFRVSGFTLGSPLSCHFRVKPLSTNVVGLFDGGPNQFDIVRNFGNNVWQWVGFGTTFNVAFSWTNGAWVAGSFINYIDGSGRNVRYIKDGSYVSSSNDSTTVAYNTTSQPVIGSINLGANGNFVGRFGGAVFTNHQDTDSQTVNIQNYLNGNSNLTHIKSWSDSLSLSDAFTLASSVISKTFSDTISFTESYTTPLIDVLAYTDTLTFDETYTLTQRGTLADSLVLSDSYTKTISWGRAISDTLPMTEAYGKSKLTLQTIDESITFTDLFRTVLVGSYSDTLDFAESLTILKYSQRTAIDTLNFVESYTQGHSLGRLVNDSLVFNESYTAIRAKYRDLNDTLVFTEKLFGVEHDVIFSDTLPLTEAYTRSLSYARSRTDHLSVTDHFDVHFSVAKEFDDQLVLKEHLYVYKTKTGITLRGLGSVLCLPSPEFNDYQANQSKIVLHKSMAGTYRSYTKNTDRDKFNWKFIITKTQKDNLEYFVNQEVNNPIIVNDWLGRQWYFRLVNDAFDFNEIGRWERVGNKFEVTLEFEGVRYYG